MTDLAAFRRDLHAHPETAFNVTRTAGRIAEVLEAAGLSVTRGIGGSGLVATLDRGDSDSAIGLRADMDALPIDEAGTPPWRSTVPGRFHGCGHDGHATMLLGAALRLAEDRTLRRRVHFIFQPDEENGRGAQAMIDDGLFARFPMRAIFGLHNMPGLPVGSFATQAGPFCSFEDNFEITITGRGGHASMPERAIDPIVTASAIVLQLQTIVARSLPPQDHAVVSVTGFETDGARNVLPGKAVLNGDCRGFRPEVSARIAARMEDIAQGIASAQGATATVTYANAFAPVVNDAAATEEALKAAEQVGETDRAPGRMGFSEDFSAYLAHRPGAFMLMGNGTDGAHAAPLHNPHYDFNDDAIGPGVAYWCALAGGAA